jgi:maltose alpha-D-glucosyltransferase/alpha-amylase
MLQQTPALPYNYQWALFLRNHDAMGVKMLTAAERQRLYQAYAPEPRMLLHTEIRRRLAPLVHGHLGRIQLLHSLLLSLPGTPILYYGDEIGMGDNIFLDDRAGVRTPMQWSGDRNAGFSRADSQRLYAPVITDPVYGYQVINVASQERDPASLLRWMQRMLALRKQHQVFGRGEMALLHPRNRAILAYIRHDATDTILIVANLSSQPQRVELDLAAYTGLIPREMCRKGEFPPIGTGPYVLTLGPYACSWLSL